MDISEYTSQRIVMADKKTMNTTIGFTFFFAGLFLFLVTYLLDQARYFVPGVLLTLIGGSVIYFSKEKTYITFDKQAGILEIMRKAFFKKAVIEQYELTSLKDAHTVKNPEGKDKLSYRVELELTDGKRVPLTRPFQKDEYGFKTTADKIRGFLASVAS